MGGQKSEFENKGIKIKISIIAIKIFFKEIASKRFPKDELFAIKDQIRRSSRSVCLNLREAWAKRKYEAHSVNKLTDCDGENSETDSSVDFARDCGYISVEEYNSFITQITQIDKMLGSMIDNPESFLLIKSNK